MILCGRAVGVSNRLLILSGSTFPGKSQNQQFSYGGLATIRKPSRMNILTRVLGSETYLVQIVRVTLK